MAVRIWLAELAAADGVERDGGAGLHQRVGEIAHETIRALN